MTKLKIALLCGPENGSPRVLAETLRDFIIAEGHLPIVFYRVKAFKRLLSYKDVRYNPIIWLLYKLKHLYKDYRLFQQLKNYDAIIICDWTPNGFYSHTYNIKKLKNIINNAPVLYYAVQYLENSPTIIEKLRSGDHALRERYDWHLTVSAVTELRGIPSPPWDQIGIYLKSTGLKPVEKKEFMVIVDFLRPGYEKFREIQISVLKKLRINYISLEREYSHNEIRELYKAAAIIFIQFPEAYGLPIAECLASGTLIGTPDSSWPMSWRLDEKLEVHGPGTLPDCFIVYDGEQDLTEKMIDLHNNYNIKKTPFEVFNTFTKYYPTFYEGNNKSLKAVLNRIRTKNFSY